MSTVRKLNVFSISTSWFLFARSIDPRRVVDRENDGEIEVFFRSIDFGRTETAVQQLRVTQLAFTTRRENERGIRRLSWKEIMKETKETGWKK